MNTTYQIAPWADVLYACDLDWWKQYVDDVKARFAGALWCQDDKAQKLGVNTIQGQYAPGLGKDRIHFGGNSGYQAVNLAYLWGATRVVLLGYDMQNTGGRTHWHGDHPRPLHKSSPLGQWVLRFQELARDLKLEGVEVLNATRQTALDCFPLVPLEEAL